MARLAGMSDLRVARFLDAWDTLDASEHQTRGTADAVCKRVGVAREELLAVVADVECRFAMCVVQMQVAIALPTVVRRSVRTALPGAGMAPAAIGPKSLGTACGSSTERQWIVLIRLQAMTKRSRRLSAAPCAWKPSARQSNCVKTPAYARVDGQKETVPRAYPGSGWSH